MSTKWFVIIIGGICAFLGFIGVNIYSRIDLIASNCRTDIKDINDKYQTDHDKITKLEDLKMMIQNDHDNLLKLEERVNNLKNKS